MNILHISSTDLVGGRFNGFFMEKSLGGCHEVEMAVWKKQSRSDKVHYIPPSNRFFHFISDLFMKVSSRMGIDGLMGIGGYLLPFTQYFKRADIIHIHLIHGFSNISLLSLPMLGSLKPMVWTLHDPWAFTGGCEHSFDCNRWLNGCASPCPHPRLKALFRRQSPFFHWRLKRRVYQRTNVRLIVASKWMRDRVIRSPLMNHLHVDLIPFGIDLNIFKPLSKKSCKKILLIPDGHQVIAFRDPGLNSDKFKGMKWLMEALNKYNPTTPCTLIIFEDGQAFRSLSPKYNVITTGWLNEADLAIALSAADVFLMPSVQESFGLMAVESMACGTPVIVFEGTALPDIIKAPKGGYAVPARDSEALCESLKNILNDDKLRDNMSRQARIIAEEEYDVKSYLNHHIKLYQKVIRTYLH